jgi:hypothetical protein
MRNPVSFGKTTHEFRVCVKLDKPEDLMPVFLWHVVIRFDQAAIVEKCLKFVKISPSSHRHPPPRRLPPNTG